MRALKRFLILVSLFLCCFAHAAPPVCFPQTDARIEASEISGISKATFTKVLDRLEKFYGPVVNKRGFNLVVNRLWSDGTINSDTDVEGSDWVINSYGGLARYPSMTSYGYAVVACHELGHHMGGAPLYSGGAWPGGGAAVEGEADYWATLNCMKDLGYTDAQIKKGSKTLARVLADLGGERMPSENTPDKSVVRETYEEHPEAQCRLDTYLAGLICPVRGEMSDHNPKVNSCYRYPTPKTYAAGSRSRCWFKP